MQIRIVPLSSGAKVDIVCFWSEDVFDFYPERLKNIILLSWQVGDLAMIGLE